MCVHGVSYATFLGMLPDLSSAINVRRGVEEAVARPSTVYDLEILPYDMLVSTALLTL
jgi:hypothetical protein